MGEKLLNEENTLNLNKIIRKYDGENSFIKSLQKNLKDSKRYIEVNGRKYKKLTERQYSSAISILELDINDL